MNEEVPFLGANLDNRPDESKEKDFNFNETVAGAAAVNWVEKPQQDWRVFPVQDQNGSFSCVAQTIKKLALINLWLKDKIFVIFSASHIYQRRSNKPAQGMIGVEAFDIWRDGITLEQFAPSELMTDPQMDNLKIQPYEDAIGKVFSIGGHIGIPIKDIDTVASIIQQTGKGVMLWFFFTQNEWSRQVPIIENIGLVADSEKAIRHSVTGVDFTLYKGKKAIIIEDSAHFGGFAQRIITEDFFNVRNFLARYPMNFKFQDQSQLTPAPTPVPNPKPKFWFVNPLVFIPLDSSGNISDPTLNNQQKIAVSALQDILKYEGFFPLNTSSTGYYGAITAKAVLQWQLKHSVASLDELNSLKGRRVGMQTIQALNNIYA